MTHVYGVFAGSEGRIDPERLAVKESWACPDQLVDGMVRVEGGWLQEQSSTQVGWLEPTEVEVKRVVVAAES